MLLYSFSRSSASFRVRIALNLKGLPYDYRSVHLQRKEQCSPEFEAVTPQQLVPALEMDGQVLTQSLAIIEYLDETHPEPALLPSDAASRVRVRSLAMDIACEIHPLNNLRVLRYLVGPAGLSEEAKDTWYRHWVEVGLTGLEKRLLADAATGRFCHGDTPTMADVVLVPQIFNAQRFKVPLDAFPTVMRIFAACMELPAFIDAQPSKCPDADA